MNRFIFSSLITLGIVSAALQGTGFAGEETAVAGMPPKVLQSVRNLPQKPMIRVLLASGKSTFQVELRGSHNVYDPYNGKKLDAAFLHSSYEMMPSSDGIIWGQAFPGVFQLIVVPDTQEGAIIVDGIQYAGAVAFYQVDNTLAAVNWISLEDMTSSLLSTTFAPKDKENKEALAALAIATRTLAYEQLLSSSQQFWDVRADSCGYKGMAIVRMDIPFQEAMKGTRNLILEPNLNEKNPLTLQSLDRLKQSIPYQQAVDLAEAGKDAGHILEKYLPYRKLQSVTQK